MIKDITQERYQPAFVHNQEDKIEMSTDVEEMEVSIEEAFKLLSIIKKEVCLLVTSRVYPRLATRQWGMHQETVNEQKLINPGDLTHVEVVLGTSHGTCVRLLFGKILYAACGEHANMLIAWAQRQDKAINCELLPQIIEFRLTATSVKVEAGELVAD